jgi:hypothetical protein
MKIIEVKMFGHSLHCSPFFADNFRRLRNFKVLKSLLSNWFLIDILKTKFPMDFFLLTIKKIDLHLPD